jgi:hypothetical protein
MSSVATPARRGLLMLGIETSCDDTAAAVVGVARLLLPSFLPSHFYLWSNLLGFILSTSLLYNAWSVAG